MQSYLRTMKNLFLIVTLYLTYHFTSSFLVMHYLPISVYSVTHLPTHTKSYSCHKVCSQLYFISSIFLPAQSSGMTLHMVKNTRAREWTGTHEKVRKLLACYEIPEKTDLRHWEKHICYLLVLKWPSIYFKKTSKTPNKHTHPPKNPTHAPPVLFCNSPWLFVIQKNSKENNNLNKSFFMETIQRFFFSCMQFVRK